MLKICLLSDSHGSRNAVENLVLGEDFDYVFFMGDGLRDFDNIDDEKLKKVSGNCDFFSQEASTMFVKLEGYKIMITHGHNYKVKLTPALLIEYAKNNFCDVVCYGHTHKQKYEKVNGIIFINPGSFKNKEYAVLTLDKNSSPQIELKSLN